jgi:hypothetical protein
MRTPHAKQISNGFVITCWSSVHDYCGTESSKRPVARGDWTPYGAPGRMGPRIIPHNLA